MKTKDDFIKEIFKINDEINELRNNQLKNMYEEDKISYYSYWYLLNPNRTYYGSLFFGFEFAGKTRVEMCTHKNNYSLFQFKSAFEEFKNILNQIKVVIKEK